MMTPSAELHLRRYLDGAISRALVDPDYAAELLGRPRQCLASKNSPARTARCASSPSTCYVCSGRRQCKPSSWLSA